MAAELALQGILVSLWKADANVAALVGDRVYDDIPKGKTFPYVHLDTSQTTDETVDDCATWFEVSQDVHVWSRATGMPETKRIMKALRDAVRTAYFAGTLPTNAGAAIDFITHESARTLRDPDGLTKHGVLTFRAIITEAEDD